jgi:hypothetical protein
MTAMIELASPLRTKNVRTLADRVRDRIATLGCERVWACSAGSHILLGMPGESAVARISPLGGGSFGLAFSVLPSAPPAGKGSESGMRDGGETAFEPILLVDTLSDVVEHALVAMNAL